MKNYQDEMIRKCLLYVIEHHPTLSTEEAEEYIAWLEKKGEKKPAWSEEDETMITDLSVIVHTYFSEISGIPFKYDLSEDKIRTWLKSLKDRVLPQPKQEWSKEDEYNLAWIREVLMGLEIADKEFETKCRKMADWLKSVEDRIALRSQNTWKPSDVQMNALFWVIENANKSVDINLSLNSLYEQLKKLK